MGGIIHLGGGTSQPKQNIFAKGLDILSGILLEPTTFIKSPSKAGELVAARRETIKSGDKSAAFDVIAETLTATAIAGGAILGAGTAAGRAAALKVGAKLAPTTIPKALGAATVGGILISSQSARKVVGQVIEDPTKVGRRAGEVIDTVVRGGDVDIIDAFKTAGLIGGGVALGAGVLAVGGKIKAKLAGGTAPIPSSSIALGASAVPIQAAATESQEPVITKTKEPSTSVPSVSVINNIKINNRSSANRRFINNVHV